MRLSRRIGADGKLFNAITAGDLDKVIRIFERGEDQDGTVGANTVMLGLTLPLREAVDHKQPAIVRWLLECGADANIEGALWCAANNEDVMSAAELLRHGADVNSRGSFDEPPLYRAVLRQHSGLVEMLLRHGANIDGKNELGRTPLRAAKIMVKRPDIAAILVAHGANLEPFRFETDGRGLVVQEPVISGAGTVMVPVKEPFYEETLAKVRKYLWTKGRAELLGPRIGPYKFLR